MIRLPALLIIFLAAALTTAGPAQADPPAHTPCPCHSFGQEPAPLHPYYRWRHGYYQNPYDYYRDLYPKYYKGFHVRHFYDLGYPRGEVHMRGRPW